MKNFKLIPVAMLLLTACNTQEKTTEATTTTPADATLAPASIIYTDSTSDKDGNKLYLAFDTTKSTVSLNFNGEKLELPQQPSGSGIRYAGNGFEYEEWQGEITLRKDGKLVFENELSSKSKVASKNKTIEEPDMPENFIGPKGERLNVGYDNSGKKPVAYLTFFDDPFETLFQIETTSTGATYKNDKMTWEVSGRNGILTVEGKKIKMLKSN